jgi:ketosteroid isomerase-like protein
VPGNTPVIGIENYSKRVEAGFADTTYIWETYSLSIENVEISSSADLAYVWGTDLLKKKTPGGVVDDAVKWVDIWRKTDGNWKLVINTWNQ